MYNWKILMVKTLFYNNNTRYVCGLKMFVKEPFTPSSSKRLFCMFSVIFKAWILENMLISNCIFTFSDL